MKFYTLLLLFCLFSLSGQSQHQVHFDFGPDQKFNVKNQKKLNPTLKLPAGTIDGDFRGLQKDGFVKIKNGALKISDSEGVLTFKTTKIHLDQTSSIAAKISMSGIGSLDKSGWVHDWVKIFYVVDGKRTLLANNKSNEYTFSGKPGNINLKPLKIEDERYFHLEFQMRVTGEDEVYSIDQIDIQQTFKATSSNGKNLLIFPNPSSQFIYFSNPEQYDLTKIKIHTSHGKQLGEFDYPINIQSLPNGNYIVQTSDLEGNMVSKPFIVLK